MTEHRDTESRRDWQRIILAAVSVLLAVVSVVGASWWTWSELGPVGTTHDFEKFTGSDWGVFALGLLSPWAIAATLVILALKLVKTDRLERITGAKWLQYIARAVAVIGASLWTWCLAFLFFFAVAIYPCFDCFPKPPYEQRLQAVRAGWGPECFALIVLGWCCGAWVVFLAHLLPEGVQRLRQWWRRKGG